MAKHSPFTPNAIGGKADSFIDTNDLGDKAFEPGAGKPWISEKDTIDSGISMHTKTKNLEVGESVHMEYAVNMYQKDFNPQIDVYNTGTKEIPDILTPEDSVYKLHGNWRSQGSTKVNVKYYVKEIINDSDITDNLTDISVKEGVSATEGFQTQLPDPDKLKGLPHDWASNIDLTKLHGGPHRIVIVAIDEQGRLSNIENRFFIKAEDVEIDPIITIKKPQEFTSYQNPFDIRRLPEYKDNKISISGEVLSPSDDYDVTYYLDGHTDEKHKVDIPQEDKKKDILTPWTANDIDVGKLIKDDKVHTIHFTVISKKSNSLGINTDIFHYKFKQNDENDHDGSFMIKAPKEINFGVKNMAPNSHADAKAKVKGQLVIEDFRADKYRKNNEITLTLESEEFKLVKPNNKDSSENETLKTDLYWKSKRLQNAKNYKFKNEELLDRVFLTDELEKNIHLKINSDQPIKQGKFGSKWKWTATDSIK